MRAATVSEFLVFDPDNPGAIVSAVGGARENARAARELISSELWEAINSFHLELRSRNLRADVEAIRVSLRPAQTYGPTTHAESAAMIAAHQAGYLL